MSAVSFYHHVKGLIDGVQHTVVAWVEGEVVKVEQHASFELGPMKVQADADLAKIKEEYEALVVKFQGIKAKANAIEQAIATPPA